MYQPEVDIYLNRLKENFDNIQSLVGSAKVMAVVKANAYGHGIVPISKTLSESGVHGFCIALVSEAEELIHSGILEPILHMGRIHKRNLALYNAGQIRCTISSMDDVKELAKHHSGSKPFKAHLKIDSGMGRMGLCYTETESVMEVLHDRPEICIEAIYSHFATAEERDTSYRDWQLERFKKVVNLANDILPETEYFHMANSASILNCPDSHFNMVRPGISLYGVSPLGMPHENLKPVMKMKASVVLLKKMKTGESVGYNRLYTAEKDEKIALLQSGYADGIPVIFSNSGSVEIKGYHYPIVGKVSMDLVAVRCEDERISEGDEAIFWGNDHEKNRLEYLAKKYDKIPYEFLTGVSSRVKRNLINE